MEKYNGTSKLARTKNGMDSNFVKAKEKEENSQKYNDTA